MNDDFIAVEPLSGYRRALLEDSVYILYLELTVSDEALGRAVLGTLSKSRFVDPDKERSFFEPGRIVAAEKRWHEKMMECFRYKTKRSAETRSQALSRSSPKTRQSSSLRRAIR